MKSLNKIISTLILVISLFSCNSNSNSTDTSANSESADSNQDSRELFSLSKEQLQSLKMDFTSPEKVQLNTEKVVNGMVMVDPNASIEIHVPYAGYLKKVSLLDGQSVTAGQVIGTVENPYFLEVQRDFIQSRIDLSKIKTEYERFQKLWNTKSISEKEWIDAKTQFESAQLKHQSLRQLLISFHLQPDKIHAAVNKV